MTARSMQVLDFLESASLPYSFLSHKRVAAMAECAYVEAKTNVLMPRNLFLCTKNKSGCYLLLAHPESRFVTANVSKRVGSSRLSFGDEALLKLLLNADPGAVSPFGLIYDTEHRVKLLADTRILKEKELMFHPLEGNCSVIISMNVFINAFLPLTGHDLTLVDMDV